MLLPCSLVFIAFFSGVCCDEEGDRKDRKCGVKRVGLMEDNCIFEG